METKAFEVIVGIADQFWSYLNRFFAVLRNAVLVAVLWIFADYAFKYGQPYYYVVVTRILLLFLILMAFSMVVAEFFRTLKTVFELKVPFVFQLLMMVMTIGVFVLSFELLQWGIEVAGDFGEKMTKLRFLTATE